jgi:transcriptional regulator with PAS, ATPase and Fis domain
MIYPVIAMVDDFRQQWHYPLLQKVLDSIADSIYVIDQHYRIVCLNQEARQRLDRKDVDVAGNLCHRAI